jgi:hypothetical protein
MADAVSCAGILDAVDWHLKAQLGHRSEQSTHQYAHLGSGAQGRLVEVLKRATTSAWCTLPGTIES